MSDVLISSRENGVAWLTLNRPDRKNSISPELREELLAALEDARTDDEVRCAVLTGAGDAFCSGVDLGRSRVTSGAAKGEKERPDLRAIRSAMKGGMQRIITAIWELDKPILAAVNGVAAGGGAQLALVCDLVIASRTARFIEIFVKRGLAVDSGGGWLLPRLIGLQKAKELVFFGDAVSAEEAASIGLVNRVVDPEALAEAVREWAERLARGPTRSIGASKMLLNRALETDLATGLDEEATAQAFVSQTQDFAEGVRAFAEKRDPDFRGR